PSGSSRASRPRCSGCRARRSASPAGPCLPWKTTHPRPGCHRATSCRRSSRASAFRHHAVGAPATSRRRRRTGCSLKTERRMGGPMRGIMILGVVLIVLGVVALAWQGITYTKKEKVVDIGPLKVEAEREKTIPLPPILGGVAVAAGVVLVVVGSRRP